MKKELLEKLISDNTVDGKVNIDVIFDEVNKSTNDIIAKNKPNMDDLKAEAYETAKDDFIKSLKLDGVDNQNQFKAYLNSLTSDEQSQQLVTLQNDYNALKEQYEGATAKVGEYESKVKEYEATNFLISKGAKAEDIDYLTFKINKMVTEDKPFDKAFDEFAKANETFFKPVAPVVQVNSGVQRQPQDGIGEKSPLEIALENRGYIK